MSAANSAGIVDGVRVDFRHADLPVGWEARSFWYVGGEGETSAGFLFPSEAKFCDAAVGDEEADLIAAKLALPRALPGDLLAVESVIDRISDRRFDHRHDATVKLAFLVLTRSSGEQVRPATPLAFYGTTQLREGPTRDAYDRLADRILSDHGHPNPHAFEVAAKYRPTEGEWKPIQDYTLSIRAALAIEEAERAWVALHDALGENPRAAALLRKALGSAVLAAFYQAKHESKPAEDHAQAVMAGADRARRQPRVTDNRLAYAAEFWSEDPSLGLGKLSRKVLEKLYWNDDQEMVSEQAMKESLKRAINRGDLVPPPESPDHRGAEG